MHPALVRLAEEGPVRFDRFQHEALYGPDGFYMSGGAAGRGADFVTAVELGAEFAICVSVELDRKWREFGEPDEFIVVEGGSGVGTLCAEVFSSAPACAEALRWVMIERSDKQREAAMGRLATEVFGSADSLPVAAVRDISQMRLLAPAHIVLANELLDNLATRVVRMGAGWEELHVGISNDRTSEVWLKLDAESARRAVRHGRGVEPGAAFPLADHAVQWVVRALQTVREGGDVIVFDYGASTAELAKRGLDGWLRTYSGHMRGRGPLEDFGSQDITCDVAFDQLPGRADLMQQLTWMEERGLALRRADAVALVDVSRIDAAGLRARSTVQEFDALADKNGIGGFTVATWNKGSVASQKGQS